MSKNMNNTAQASLCINKNIHLSNSEFFWKVVSKPSPIQYKKNFFSCKMQSFLSKPIAFFKRTGNRIDASRDQPVAHYVWEYGRMSGLPKVFVCLALLLHIKIINTYESKISLKSAIGREMKEFLWFGSASYHSFFVSFICW